VGKGSGALRIAAIRAFGIFDRSPSFLRSNSFCGQFEPLRVTGVTRSVEIMGDNVLSCKKGCPAARESIGRAISTVPLLEQLEQRRLLASVLYRVNAGGPQVAADVNWSADTKANPSTYTNAAAAASSTYTGVATMDLSHGSVPAGTPASIFHNQRWDAVSGSPMQWDFPVAPGTYDVRLYFAETYGSTKGVGKRVFDVSIEGTKVLSKYDIFADVGGNKGVVKSFSVNADGNIDIDFAKVANNPLIMGIEILSAGTPGQLGMSATTLNFGGKPVGETAQQSIVLTNQGSTGDPAIVIDATTLGGTDAGQFSDAFDDLTDITLQPGQSYTLPVTYAPTGLGVHAASVTIVHNGVNAVSVQLGGTGVELNASNLAPVVNAGANKSGAPGASIALSGSVNDDGNPAGQTLTSTWTKQTGPGTVAFNNANSPATTATFSQAGTYVLRLVASDGTLQSFDEVTVTVSTQQTTPVGFGKSQISGLSISKPTSLQFGPDGKLYVASQSGTIYAVTLNRTGPNAYNATASTAINLIKNIVNHNDDGSLASGVTSRLVTGLTVAGTATNPVIYAISSDPRIGGGNSGNETNLDTNSGVLSRLTWNGSSWVKLDLVRGLPRSEENHTGNGLFLDKTNNALFIAYGGNTNMGAPSNNFALLPEYALSAAILKVDLTQIGNTTYDLPTLNDESRSGTNDSNDPFGGNDGKNQAMLVSGGPVQVYSPGYRNPYDVLITRAGKMFTIDNGANSGWGDVPLTSGGQKTTNATKGQATNKVSEPGVTHPDALHLITGQGYYGGHPNPTRANRGNTFNSGNPQSPIPAGMENPNEGVFLGPASNGSLTNFPASTNGMAEYTTGNFGGALDGDLLAAGHDNIIYRIDLNAAGTGVVSKTALFSNVGTLPLDVTTLGATTAYPGTVWVADYVAGKIIVLEPNDFGGATIGGTGADDPTLDDDNDGYNNADEIDNGTNPLSAGDIPADFDDDLTSDLNDANDDNDALLDINDPFAIDATNGRGRSIPFSYSWENEGEAAGGILNMGFTGHMTNGADNYRDLFSAAGVTAGGAAGVFTVDEIGPGTALGASNNQKYALQFGFNATSASQKFIAHTRVLAPFAGVTPEAGESMGFFIGTGDQDNYVKLEVIGDAGGGVRAVVEIDGISVELGLISFDITGVEAVDLYLAVNPATLAITPRYSVTIGGVTSAIQDVGASTTIPASWLDSATAPAIGIIGQTPSGSPVPASWDFMEILPDEANQLGVDVTSITFPGTVLGQTATATIKLSNKGGPGAPDIIIDPIELTGANADEFGFDLTAPITLVAGQQVSLGVTFTPTSGGTKTASIAVTHTGDNTPINVAVNAEAVAGGLKGEYFDAINLTGLKTTRIDPVIDFNWTTAPPGTAITPDSNYSERWTGSVYIPTAGTWQFSTQSNDGVRLWINNSQIINNWTQHAVTTNTGSVTVAQPGWYPLKLEHYQQNGVAVIQLSYAGPNQPKVVIPATAFSSDVPLVGQLSVVPTTGAFGDTLTGTSKTIGLMLTNTGTASLTVNSTAISGTSASQFADGFNDQPLVLAPGAATTINVQFNPTGTGSRSASLAISHTAEGGSLVVPLTGNSTAASVAGWSTGASMSVALGEVGAAIIGNIMYVVGDGSSKTLAYNISNNTWTDTLAQRQHVYKDQVMHAVNGKLYLFGGVKYTPTGKNALNYVQIYNPVTNSWSLGASMPTGAFAINSGVINGKIYVAGGVAEKATNSFQTTNKTYVYNPATNSWTALAPMKQPVDSAASGSDGQKLWVFGGRFGGDAPGNGFDYVQVYDPATNTWISSEDTTGPGALLAPLPQARGGISVAPFVNGEFYVIGGETVSGPGATPDNVYNRVDIYKPDTNTWRLGPNMPTARHGMSPVANATKLFVAGGGVVSSKSSSKILEILDLTT